MARKVTIQRRVAFSETDLAGIVHFTNLFKYMEEAEAALFREIDWPLVDFDGAVWRGWPRVTTEAMFTGPLRFGDVVEVELTLEHLTAKRMTYRFQLTRISSGAPEREEEPEKRLRVAKGSITVAYVRRELAGELRAVLVPEELLQRLTPYAEKVEV